MGEGQGEGYVFSSSSPSPLGRRDVFVSVFCLHPDLLQHPLHILQDLPIPEAEHKEAMPLQKSRTLFIIDFPFFVTASIKLNDESCFGAEKVRDEGSEGHLPPELETTTLSISKLKPETMFCRSLTNFSQDTGTLESSLRRAEKVGEHGERV